MIVVDPLKDADGSGCIIDFANVDVGAPASICRDKFEVVIRVQNAGRVAMQELWVEGSMNGETKRKNQPLVLGNRPF